MTRRTSKTKASKPAESTDVDFAELAASLTRPQLTQLAGAVAAELRVRPVDITEGH